MILYSKRMSISGPRGKVLHPTRAEKRMAGQEVTTCASGGSRNRYRDAKVFSRSTRTTSTRRDPCTIPDASSHSALLRSRPRQCQFPNAYQSQSASQERASIVTLYETNLFTS